MDESIILKQTMFLAEREELYKQIKAYGEIIKVATTKSNIIKDKINELNKSCQHVNLNGTSAIADSFSYNRCDICGEWS
jgi:hypothetical protein